ncbi:hypothetical protein BB558_001707 [Smittium angustum]|uniref:Mediator complex subunit 15 KIX domain-containing protein n=1 Tax=Smittium angustum TaxID=133377 RepID=A0A2U1JAM6_SMIAN|nr:hypothetical protein BB558_001707 [Smittium angustum]
MNPAPDWRTNITTVERAALIQRLILTLISTRPQLEKATVQQVATTYERQVYARSSSKQEYISNFVKKIEEFNQRNSTPQDKNRTSSSSTAIQNTQNINETSFNDHNNNPLLKPNSSVPANNFISKEDSAFQKNISVLGFDKNGPNSNINLNKNNSGINEFLSIPQKSVEPKNSTSTLNIFHTPNTNQLNLQNIKTSRQLSSEINNSNITKSATNVVADKNNLQSKDLTVNINPAAQLTNDFLKTGANNLNPQNQSNKKVNIVIPATRVFSILIGNRQLNISLQNLRQMQAAAHQKAEKTTIESLNILTKQFLTQAYTQLKMESNNNQNSDLQTGFGNNEDPKNTFNYPENSINTPKNEIFASPGNQGHVVKNDIKTPNINNEGSLKNVLTAVSRKVASTSQSTNSTFLQNPNEINNTSNKTTPFTNLNKNIETSKTNTEDPKLTTNSHGNNDIQIVSNPISINGSSFTQIKESQISTRTPIIDKNTNQLSNTNPYLQQNSVNPSTPGINSLSQDNKNVSSVSMNSNSHKNENTSDISAGNLNKNDYNLESTNLPMLKSEIINDGSLNKDPTQPLGNILGINSKENVNSTGSVKFVTSSSEAIEAIRGIEQQVFRLHNSKKPIHNIPLDEQTKIRKILPMLTQMFNQVEKILPIVYMMDIDKNSIIKVITMKALYKDQLASCHKSSEAHQKLNKLKSISLNSISDQNLIEKIQKASESALQEINNEFLLTWAELDLMRTNLMNLINNVKSSIQNKTRDKIHKKTSDSLVAGEIVPKANVDPLVLSQKTSTSSSSSENVDVNSKAVTSSSNFNSKDVSTITGTEKGQTNLNNQSYSQGQPTEIKNTISITDKALETVDFTLGSQNVKYAPNLGISGFRAEDNQLSKKNNKRSISIISKHRNTGSISSASSGDDIPLFKKHAILTQNTEPVPTSTLVSPTASLGANISVNIHQTNVPNTIRRKQDLVTELNTLNRNLSGNKEANIPGMVNEKAMRTNFGGNQNFLGGDNLGGGNDKIGYNVRVNQNKPSNGLNTPFGYLNPPSALDPGYNKFWEANKRTAPLFYLSHMKKKFENHALENKEKVNNALKSVFGKSERGGNTRTESQICVDVFLET